jgi:hypothetical protein
MGARHTNELFWPSSAETERMGVHQRNTLSVKMQASSLAVAGEADAPTLKLLCGLPQSSHYQTLLRWRIGLRLRSTNDRVSAISPREYSQWLIGVLASRIHCVGGCLR